MTRSWRNVTWREFGKNNCNGLLEGRVRWWYRARKKYLESQFSLNPHFIYTAKKLKKKYDLAVLSNGVGRWSAYLRRKYQLDNLIKEVVVSGEHGYRKPDVRIYRVLLDRLKASTADCIYVDDNLKNLKQGAELGMTTVHSKRNFLKGKFEANYTVKSFQELPNLLEYRS